MVEQATYTRSGYSTLLTEIQGRLAELHYIDAALDYFESFASDVRRYESQQNAQDPFNIQGSPTALTSVELGSTHPFDKTIEVRSGGANSSAPDRDEVEAHLGTLVGPADGFAAGVVDAVRSSVETLTEPLTAAFEVVSESLANDLQTPIATQVADDFGGIQQSLADWDGQAAENFATNFYNPFGDCVDNQAWLAGELAKVVAAGGAIINLGQNSLMNVAHATNEALDDQLLKRQEENDSPSLKETLTLLSKAAGLLAIVTIAAPAAAATLAAVSTISSYAADAVPDDGSSEILEIEGASAEELGEQLGSESTNVTTNTDSNWNSLTSDKIAELEGHVEGVLGQHLLFPRRPDLADGLTPGELVHDSAGP